MLSPGWTSYSRFFHNHRFCQEQEFASLLDILVENSWACTEILCSTVFHLWLQVVSILDAVPYRGTSLIRNSAPLGPYSRNMSGALWWT